MKPTLLAGLLPCLLSAQVYLRDIGIEQHMGAQVPLDVPFTNEQNNSVSLRQYTGRPAILALVYYNCPSLCTLVLNGIVRSLTGLSLMPGRDFEVIAVSFDPRDNWLLARDKKQTYAKSEGWHFLTGPEAASRTLADAIGFRYAYDPVSNQYAHPSGIMILTPEGRVTRYFYGIDYPARDVKLALVEASAGKIGSPIDAVQLFCFHYDPATGKYGFAIMNALKLAGILTVGALGAFIVIALRREKRH